MARSSPCLGEDSGQGWNQLWFWQMNREATKAEDELEPAQVWNALVEPHRENLFCAGQVHTGSSLPLLGATSSADTSSSTAASRSCINQHWAGHACKFQTVH